MALTTGTRLSAYEIVGQIGVGGMGEVALLRKIRGLAAEEHFVRAPLIYGNAERYLQLAIQAVLDISNHIVADMKLNLAHEPRDLFPLLARHKV